MVSSVLAIKDDVELNHIKKACEITSKIYSKHLKDQLVNIIDGEKVPRNFSSFLLEPDLMLIFEIKIL